jgi:sugar phosphate isomerase/epimerase
MSWLSTSEFKALKSTAGELGVSFPIAGIYPAFHFEGVEAEREWESLARVVERSAEVGAKQVKVFAGAIGSDAALKSGARARSMDFAGRFVEMVNGLDMGLNVETHPDTLCDSLASTQAFLAAFPNADIGVCFQPFDFGSTEQTVTDFDVLREHVRHVHLQGRRDDQMSLFSEADIDYAPVFEAFSEAGFEGALSIEFVKDCVVARPENMSVQTVLANAALDREHVLRLALDARLPLLSA